MKKQQPRVHTTLEEAVSIAQLPSEFGSFTIYGYHNERDDSEHVAIVKGDPSTFEDPVMVRIHSECLTGDALGSLRCDCRKQLQAALASIEKVGQGIVIYLQQEGRGIGLLNKLKAYCLQDSGLDTVEANEHLGFAADLREYSMAAHILQDLGVKRIRLMTNNPLKISQLQKYNIEIVERVPINIRPNVFNIDYLNVKADKMGHLLVKTQDLINFTKEKINIDKNLDHIWPALIDCRKSLTKKVSDSKEYWALSGNLDTAWEFHHLTEESKYPLPASDLLIIIDFLGNLDNQNTLLSKISKSSQSSILFILDSPFQENVVREVRPLVGEWDQDEWQTFSLYLRILIAQRQANLDKRPFLMAHLAQTLDGKIAAINGDSRWISNEENLKHAHRLRALHDAVMVGADTATLDNPKLTVRLVPGEHPTPIIIEGKKNLSLDSHGISMLQLHEKIIVLYPEGKERYPLSNTAQEKVIFLPVSPDKNDNGEIYLNPKNILSVLYNNGITSIFLEGGGCTISYFLQSGCIELLHLHFSPIILGSGRPSFNLPVVESISDGIRFKMKHFNLDGEVLLELFQVNDEET